MEKIANENLRNTFPIMGRAILGSIEWVYWSHPKKRSVAELRGDRKEDHYNTTYCLNLESPILCARMMRTLKDRKLISQSASLSLNQSVKHRQEMFDLWTMQTMQECLLFKSLRFRAQENPYSTISIFPYSLPPCKGVLVWGTAGHFPPSPVSFLPPPSPPRNRRIFGWMDAWMVAQNAVLWDVASAGTYLAATMSFTVSCAVCCSGRSSVCAQGAVCAGLFTCGASGQLAMQGCGAVDNHAHQGPCLRGGG